MGKYLCGIDQGTTSSRAMVFSKDGTVAGEAHGEFTQIFPKPGWVEHDPMQIWHTQLDAIRRSMSGIEPQDIAAIGISNQRETTIVWNRHTGLPIFNAIVWQCRRTAAICDSLKPHAEKIREATGLVVDAYFSATKLKWILENIPGALADAEKGDLIFGTVDTWIIWNLTGGRVHVTDYTNASRTMLFNINELRWDDEILRLLGIPRQMLPQVKPSCHTFGTTKKGLFGREIPICSVAGDQHAALFGQCCFDVGMVKNTYGTGSFILMQTGPNAVKSKNDLLTTIAWGIGRDVEYALEGSVFVSGASVQWLRDGLGLVEDAASTSAYADSVPNTNGCYVVPAFTGLGAPYWDQYARGVIVGLTRGVEKAHIIRATLESIAYQSVDVMRAMEADAGMSIKRIRVDGGACTNDFLMQFQADVLGVDVVRPAVIESTVLGAACMAGLTIGMYKSKADIENSVHIERVFSPKMPAKAVTELLAGWHRAVKHSFGWASV